MEHPKLRSLHAYWDQQRAGRDFADRLPVLVVASAGLRKIDADDPVPIDDVGENLLHQCAPARAPIRRTVAELGDFIDAALGDHGTDQASMIDKLQRERLFR